MFSIFSSILAFAVVCCAFILSQILNILHFTVKGIAHGIEGFCADSLAFLHAVERIGRKTLFIDQTVFRNSILIERFVKRLVADHEITTHLRIISQFTILNLLTMHNILNTMRISYTKRRLRSCVEFCYNSHRRFYDVTPAGTAIQCVDGGTYQPAYINASDTAWGIITIFIFAKTGDWYPSP